MKSTTSFFNKSIFKKNTSRFWPIWGSYLAILLIIMPFSLANEVQLYQYNETAVFGPTAAGMHILEAVTSQAFFIFLFIACCAMAVAVFSYMYSSRSVSMVASLPIARTKMFLTSSLSGLVWLLGGQLVCVVVTAITELAFGIFSIVYLLEWLAISWMAIIFFYGLAVFCAMLTGNIAAAPFAYVIINFVAIVVEFLVMAVISLLVFGASGNFEHILLPFSPLLKMCSTDAAFVSPLVTYETEMYIDRTGAILNEMGNATGQYADIVYNGWMWMGIYCAVGILLFVAAVFIYKKRRMETAGDVIAIKPLKPVFKYCLAFGASISLGVGLFAIAFQYTSLPTLPALIFCVILTGAIGYFAAEMLMRKSFRAFDKWRGFIVYAAISVVLLLAVDMDLFAYERYIPEVDKIKSISMNYRGERIYLSEGSKWDEELAEQIIDLHKNVIQNKRIHENTVAFNNGRKSLHITYLVDSGKNGKIVTRDYLVAYSEEIVNDESSDISKIDEFWNSTPVKLIRYSPSVEVGPTTMLYAYVNASLPEYDDWVELELTSSEALELYQNCIIPDLMDTSLGTADDQYRSGYDYTLPSNGDYEVPVDMEYAMQTTTSPDYEWRINCEFSFKTEAYSNNIFNSETVSINLTPDASRSISYIMEKIKAASVEN